MNGAPAVSHSPSVLFVVESCGYGLARHLVDLLDGALERGWRAAVLHSGNRGDDRTLETALLRLMSHENFQSFYCPMPLWPHWRDVRVIREILRAISACQADLVHCHSMKAGFVGRLAAAFAGKPCVYTPHAPMCMSPAISPLVRGASSWYEAVFGRIGAAFVAVSEEEMKCALRIGVPGRSVRLIPNGITIPPEPSAHRRREMRARFRLAPGSVCAGFVGRLCSQKAVGNLLRAWKIVVSARPEQELRLVIVGEGPLRADLEVFCRNLGLSDSVVWAGHCPGTEAMTAFDLFVLPSDYEGMPYVFLEAMAAGLPVVTTCVGGARMAVAHGVNGYVVPRQNPAKLAEAIAEVARSEHLRRQMGAASRARVARFPVARMTEETFDLYRELLGSRPAGSPSATTREELRTSGKPF